MLRRKLSVFLPVVIGLVSVAMPVAADQYSLTLDHCTGTCGTSPFGTIDVAQDGANTVKLTVTLSSADKFVSTGFPGSLGFDLVGNPTISVSNATAGWSLVSSTAGNLRFDGFGNFDYAFTCDVCGNGSSNPFAGPISFDITAVGLTPASFQELSRIPPGTESAYFVADIIGSNGNSGPVGATLSSTAAPEPSTCLLFGAGIALFGAWRSRRSRLLMAEQTISRNAS